MEYASELFCSLSDIKRMGTTIEKIIEDLSVPNPEYANQRKFGAHKRFYKKIEPTLCYLKQKGSTYILPRYYFGEPDKDSLTHEGRAIDFKFLWDLRDYQQEFYSSNNDAIKNCTGLLYEVPCGHGKTVMAIYRSSLIKRQTLILVPTYYLANQWKGSIEKCSDASVTVITASDTSLNLASDFTVVVMDLFNNREFPKDFIDNIGHVILDEAHRVGADTYIPILEQVPAKYRTALTATFRRADGVHKILRYHFGEQIQMTNQFPKPSVYSVNTGLTIGKVLSKKIPHEAFKMILEELGIKFIETASCLSFGMSPEMEEDILAVTSKLSRKKDQNEVKRCLRMCHNLPYTTLETYLSENCARRKRITKVIKMCLESGRTILFLSKRKKTLQAMYKVFAEYKPVLITSETNNRTKEEDAYLQNEARLVLGVNQLAKEGLDIDRLDTLIVDLPIKDLEQAIGRVSRLHPTKKEPLVFYMLDAHHLTYAVFNNSRKYIKINGELKGNLPLCRVQKAIDNP